jgi:hypothetical protein
VGVRDAGLQLPSVSRPCSYVAHSPSSHLNRGMLTMLCVPSWIYFSCMQVTRFLSSFELMWAILVPMYCMATI